MYKMRNTLCCIAQIRNNYNTELWLVVLGELFLSEQLELSAYNDRVISSGPDTVCFYRDFAPPIWDMASDFRK